MEVPVVVANIHYRHGSLGFRNRMAERVQSREAANVSCMTSINNRPMKINL